MSHSLLSLLNINMPSLYGEGSRAFRRVRKETVRTRIDGSLLRFDPPCITESNISGSELGESSAEQGVLAVSVSGFSLPRSNDSGLSSSLPFHQRMTTFKAAAYHLLVRGEIESTCGFCGVSAILPGFVTHHVAWYKAAGVESDEWG